LVFSLKITSNTKLYALIGDPVEHSLSPLMQNAAFNAAGLDAVYIALKVEKKHLKEAVEGFRAIELPGFNVTIPHKIRIIKYLDEVNDHAAAIGAVNTVLNDEGRLIGYNTDGVGAIEALRGEGVNPERKSVTILGAGGAARAVAFSLANMASRIILLNRTGLKAIKLAKELSKTTGTHAEGKPLNHINLKKAIECSEILVNATSVGMHPNIGESLADASIMRSGLVVFDVVYNPVNTRLLQEAQKAGAKIVSGLMMLVHQGALAFKLWTGREAPIEVMVKATREGLGV
jgi:shikimate dehydrogenase